MFQINKSSVMEKKGNIVKQLAEAEANSCQDQKAKIVRPGRIPFKEVGRMTTNTMKRKEEEEVDVHWEIRDLEIKSTSISGLGKRVEKNLKSW